MSKNAVRKLVMKPNPDKNAKWFPIDIELYKTPKERDLDAAFILELAKVKSRLK